MCGIFIDRDRDAAASGTNIQQAFTMIFLFGEDPVDQLFSLGPGNQYAGRYRKFQSVEICFTENVLDGFALEEPVYDLPDLHYLWSRKGIGLVQMNLQPVKTGHMLQYQLGQALHFGRGVKGREFLPDYFFRL